MTMGAGDALFEDGGIQGRSRLMTSAAACRLSPRRPLGGEKRGSWGRRKIFR